MGNNTKCSFYCKDEYMRITYFVYASLTCNWTCQIISNISTLISCENIINRGLNVLSTHANLNHSSFETSQFFNHSICQAINELCIYQIKRETPKNGNIYLNIMRVNYNRNITHKYLSCHNAWEYLHIFVGVAEFFSGRFSNLIKFDIAK